MANSVGNQGDLLSGSKAVTAAGTAETLASDGLYGSLMIRAKYANGGYIYVGGKDVDSSTNEGLASGDSILINPRPGKAIQLNDIYIDASVSGEGVDFYASF